MAPEVPSAPTLSRWPLILTGLLLLALYCLPNYAYYHDGIADAVEATFYPWRDRFHPHHLGYTPFIALLTLGLQKLGLTAGALDIMIALSRIASMITMMQVYLLMRAGGMQQPFALAVTGLYGLAFTTWAYGTTAAVYPLALCCLLNVYGHALSWGNREGAVPTSSLARAAGWLLAAILFHQMALLMIPGLLCWLWWIRRDAGKQEALRQAGRGVLWFAVPVTLLYGIAGTLLFGMFHFEGLWRWATRYGHQPRWWYWSQVPEEFHPLTHWLETVADSHGRLLWAMPIGERYGHETASPLLQRLQSLLPMDLYFILTPLLLFWIVAGIAAALWYGWQRSATYRQIIVLQAAWVLPIVLFTSLFMPENSFYRLYYLPMLLFTLVAPLDFDNTSLTSRKLAWGVIALMASFTVVSNLAYGWGPRSTPAINPRYASLPSLDMLKPGPMVVSEEHGWEDLMYLQYFLSQPVYEGVIIRSSLGDPESPPGGTRLSLVEPLASQVRELAQRRPGEFLLQLRNPQRTDGYAQTYLISPEELNFGKIQRYGHYRVMQGEVQ